MTTLDQDNILRELDTANMSASISDLPKNLEQSYLDFEKISIPADFKHINKICLCGMGGSAVANNLVANLPQDKRNLPMKVIRGYEVPAWVDANTLVVLTSHSGATNETLSAFKDAADSEAKIFIVAEKGELEILGKKEGAPIFDYDTTSTPRASLGYQLGAIFGLFKRLNIFDYQLEPAIELMKKMEIKLNPLNKTEDNFAKQLAYCAFDRFPVIVSSGILKSVGWRWKTQFNENAKHTAFTEFLPEAMHNAIEGLQEPKRFKDDLIYYILQNTYDDPKLINQFDCFKQVLQQKNIRYEIIEAEGKDVFSQKLSTLFIGDWVSYYLAMLNNIDPTPVPTISEAKK